MAWVGIKLTLTLKILFVLIRCSFSSSWARHVISGSWSFSFLAFQHYSHFTGAPNENIVQNHLRWLNTVLSVCEYTSFAKSWQEKGCISQAETWQVKNILMKDFDLQVKFGIFVVSMATWTIEYNLKISLLLSL